MTCRSTVVLPVLVACFLLAALAAAAATADDDASDVRAGPRALSVPPPDPLLIDRPGDRDWYIEPGARLGRPGREWITVNLSGGSGCTSAKPLRIALHNPEGAFVRAVSFAQGEDGLLAIPALPGNYFINVYAVDDGCSGLTYQLGRAAVGEPAIAGETRCDAKRRQRGRARELLSDLRKRRGEVTGAARLRYDAYVNTARSQHAAARRAVARTCRSSRPARPKPPPPPVAGVPGESGGGGGG